MVWDWLPNYSGQLLDGLWVTIQLLVESFVMGMLIAIPLGLVQVTGPKPLAWLAKGFCTIIRGTPLLIQLWLIYYGIGSIFPSIPGIRESMIWPILREAFPYALFAFTISTAGYEGEVMRGAFHSVGKGQLEAARSVGMSPFMVLRRIWLPQAFRNVFPTLAGEAILNLKSTPLAATITVFDVYGVTSVIRQETYRIYEPLAVLALIYLILAGAIVVMFRYFEKRMPNLS